MSKPYGKLVRDNIPQIIESQGQTPVIRTLSSEEYIACLHEKLSEEVAEYLADHSIEELCDILEVIEAIIAFREIAVADLEQRKQQKADKNGKFEKRIYLESVIK